MTQCLYPAPLMLYPQFPPFDYSFPQISRSNNKLETTSCDGKPLMNPAQFAQAISYPYGLHYYPVPFCLPKSMIPILAHKKTSIKPNFSQKMEQNKIQNNLGKRSLETILNKSIEESQMKEATGLESVKKNVFLSSIVYKMKKNEEISIICIDLSQKSEEIFLERSHKKEASKKCLHKKRNLVSLAKEES